MADCSNDDAKKALTASIHLHMLTLVQQNLAWYQLNGCVSEKASMSINDEVDRAVKDYAPYMNTVLASLGCPETPKRIGPIARDYVAFNSQPDPENFESSGALFDFR